MGAVEREHHLRKQVGAIALITSPILGLIGAAVSPALDSDEQEWLGNLAEASDRASFGMILMAASIALGVFAVFTIAHMLRERGSMYGDVGAGLAGIGFVLTTIFIGMQLMANELATSAVPTEAAAAVVEDANTNPVAIVALVGAMAWAIGLLVLAFGLIQAQAAPTLSAVGLGLFAVGAFAGFFGYLTPVLIASFAVLTASLLPLGWYVLRETDEQWEHTPRFHGFHAST